MVHRAADKAVNVAPLTVHADGVVEVNVTGKPEVAVALTVVVPPTLTVGGVKVTAPMVWLCLLKVMLPVTCAAAL